MIRNTNDNLPEHAINLIDPLIGLVGKNKLRHRNKKLSELASNDEVNQRFRRASKDPRRFSKIVSPEILHSIQIDLMDISNMAAVNRRKKFLFAIIDVFSRYVWVFPIKNKQPTTILEVFKPWINETEKELNKKVKNITSDFGRHYTFCATFLWC